MKTPEPSLDDLRIDRAKQDLSRSSKGAAWVVGLILLVAVVGIGAWWALGARATQVQAAQVREVAAGRGGSAVLNASGYVTARRQATVSSKITGKILEVLVEEGMAVEEGQMLARLDGSLIRSELTRAEAELQAVMARLTETEVLLKDARRQLRRTQELSEEGVVSESELDDAQAKADSLAARLQTDQAGISVSERQVDFHRQRLDDTVIRAPFPGVATSKNAQPGEMISPVSAGGGFTRTGICTLVDMESLEIEVDVNETYINRVSAGQPVEATLDAYPDWKIPARVITIVPAADRQKATVKVRIGFDSLDARILPDMGIKVTLLEDISEKQVQMGSRLYIPSEAVRREGGHEVVYVVQGDVLERRAVQTVGTSGGETEVTAGLRAGEWVVVASEGELQEGDRVTVGGKS